MPALSRTQEQLNFFSDLIAVATILATKALGEITLWPRFCSAKPVCMWGAKNPLMEFARSNLESL